MLSYRGYNSKHYYSHRHKYHTYAPRHHRYKYDEENFESYGFHQPRYNRRSYDNKGEYDRIMVQSTRASSSVYWKPTQRPASLTPSPPLAVQIIEKPMENNWKLMADPFFCPVPNKIYRYDGTVPNDSSYTEVNNIKDPRTFQSKNKIMNLPIDLPVPTYKFLQVDNNYVGQRPKVEVTFSNLDDKIDTALLTNLVVKYGKAELVQIFYHPITKKHLSLAKIIFDDPISAKSCVQSLNKTSIMGKVVNVFLDPFATQCKIMFDKKLEENSKPPPEVHKIKLLPISHKKKQFVKLVKSKEESVIKSQTKEKFYLSTVNNCKSYNYDHATISPTTSSLLSVQSNSSGYNSIGGNLEYNETYSYPYNRYCNIPMVPNNHWLGVTSPSSLTPELPLEPNLYSAQSKLNLKPTIEMVLSEKDNSHESPLLSTIKKEPDNISDTEKEISHEEKMVSVLPKSPSPFLSKELYIECFETAIKKLNITGKKEILEARNLLNSTIRNVICNTTHESPDSDNSFSSEHLSGKSSERNTLDDIMCLTSFLSHDEEMIENDTIIPQCEKLSNYPSNGSYSPQLNNTYDYQHFPCLPSYPSGPLLLSPNFYKSKPPYNGLENENLSPKLRKKLMDAVIKELKIIIKNDLTKKMSTTVAFNTFDQWWEQAKRQSKFTSVTNEESKSATPTSNLSNIFETGTEGLKTLAINGFGLGFREAIPKMPSFCKKKKKESSSKKTSKQFNNGSDQEEMVSISDSETKVNDDCGETRLTFAKHKYEGRELFNSDSSTSTSDSSIHSFDEKESSSDSSSNEDSIEQFKWKNKFEKLHKSVKLEDFRRIKELTPAENETHMTIDDLSSSNEKRSLIKYKWDGKTVKQKIDDNLPIPVESKKHLLNEIITPTEENSSKELKKNLDCFSRQIPDWKTKVDTTNTCFKNQAIINKLKSPKFSTIELKQPLAVRDYNKIENIDKLTKQTQSGDQMKTKYFNRRDMVQEATVLHEFFSKGVDVEDINYLKLSYESLLSNETVNCDWLNETHWISHPVSDIPIEVSLTKKKDEWKIHDTGSARTEGYYKIDSKQKANYKYHFGQTASQINLTKELKYVKESSGKTLAHSREARSNQRRLLTAFKTTSHCDLLKFNVLKFRKKQLRFGKSVIHDWGLFAMENIAADEMIIEYVGQMIRPVLADLREQRYEATGIGSYLFRMDLDTIVDATKCGNLSRFINHSCNPNCYAKVIQIDGRKKIVIYSKEPIFVNEEITYDYKFPIEENKIPCLCGTHCCRGTLN